MNRPRINQPPQLSCRSHFSVVGSGLRINDRLTTTKPQDTLTHNRSPSIKRPTPISRKVTVRTFLPFNVFFPFNDHDFSDLYETSNRHDRALNSVPIVTVKVTDKDSGDAGTVEYQLEEPSSFFEVGSSDGGVRLTSSPESGRCNCSASF